jgi:hypothetical protein
VPVPPQIVVELVTRNESGSDPAGDGLQLAGTDQRANVVLGAPEFGGDFANRQGCGPLHGRSIARADGVRRPRRRDPAGTRRAHDSGRLDPHNRAVLARRESGGWAVKDSRLPVILIWAFTPRVDRAFSTIIWPILGLIFAPLTTLLYVILWNTGGRGATGWEWILVILAPPGDLATSSGRRLRQAIRRVLSPNS